MTNDNFGEEGGWKFSTNITNKKPIALNVKSSHNSVRKVQESNWGKWKININRKDHANGS